MKVLVLISVLLVAGAWQCFAAADRLERSRLGAAGSVPAAAASQEDDPLAAGTPQEDALRLAGVGLGFLALLGVVCFVMVKRRDREESGQDAGLSLGREAAPK